MQIVLTDIQKQMLKEMLTWGDYCYSYWRFEIKSDKKWLQKNDLKKEMKGLLQCDYVEYVKGLIDDDGKTCGSGFCIKYSRINEIKQIVSEYERSLLNIDKDIKRTDVKNIIEAVNLHLKDSGYRFTFDEKENLIFINEHAIS